VKEEFQETGKNTNHHNWLYSYAHSRSGRQRNGATDE